MGLKRDQLPVQKFVQTLEEVEALAESLLAKERDVYFGCSKFANGDNRAKSNAAFMQSFWMDLDCGPNKSFTDQAAAITALQTFCRQNTLPKPTLVSSGYGIHVYWALTSSITQAQWLPVAERLKSLAAEQQFPIDTTATADAARILRIPETKNWKNPDDPRDVEIITLSDAVEFAAFKTVLNVLDMPGSDRPDFIPNRPNELTLALLGNKITKFKQILQKTLAGEGCAQIKHAVENQETLEEPLWRAVLSIAHVCEDRDKAIEIVSSGHPSYDPVDAQRKAQQTKGPYTCDTYEKLNPEGCKDCPLKGKIKSPVVLGHDIARDEAPAETDSTEGEVTNPSGYPIPTYPAPYFRGRNGGVYRDMGPETEPVLIYEHDLVLVKRLLDPKLGECAWLRRFLPRDGVEEFAVPMSALLSRDKMREILPAKGVLAGQKQMELIMNYLISVAKEMQIMKSAEKMRTQFGWADDDTKIILGEREICDNGVFYSPPSSTTMALAPVIKPVGSFDVWKQTFNTYAGEGFEPHAFAALTGFGAPLMKFMNIHGCLINLVNNESGTGKSTILHMMNSIIGHPSELLLHWKDTYNVIMHRFGVMNNLAIGIDEITKMDAELVSDILYSSTQGRGKHRMERSANEERINHTKWALPIVATSNSSIVDKLSSLKTTFDGEMMRFIEYKIELTGGLSKADAIRIFGALFENYGHAGEPYMRYLVANMRDSVALVRKVQDKLDRDIGFESRERFWSGMAACNIAGGMISQSLKLHDYNLKNVYRWLVPTMVGMKQTIIRPRSEAASVLGEFINRHMPNVLVVNAGVDARSKLAVPPMVMPKGELLIRIEPDTKRMFIGARAFKKFCAQGQITYQDALFEMKVKGILLDTVKKRMARGSGIDSPTVDALMLDCTVGDFVDIDSYAEKAAVAQ